MLSMDNVDVIIPCYNAGEFIEKTIASILNQTMKNISIIVINDGSTDDTKKKLAQFEEKITVLEHKNGVNKGAPASMNLGLIKSKSPYIAFLDADDIFYSDKLEKQMNILNNNNEIGLVYTNGYVIDKNDNKLHNIFPENFKEINDCSNLLLDNYIRTPSMVMVRRALLERTGIFDERLKYSKDHDMWIKFAEISRLYYLNEPLVGYRQYEGQQSGHRNQWDEGFGVLNNAIKRHQYSKSIINKRKAVINYRLGEHNFKNQKLLKSIQHFFHAFIYDPKRSIGILFPKFNQENSSGLAPGLKRKA